jgi:hypothetical protein
MQFPLVNNIKCFSLSNIKSIFRCLGSVLVHKYIHWAVLTRKALEARTPPPSCIGDFIGPYPPTGFGPYRASQLRGHGKGETRSTTPTILGGVPLRRVSGGSVDLASSGSMGWAGRGGRLSPGPGSG